MVARLSVIAAALALFALACDGGDSGTVNPSPQATASPTPKVTPSPILPPSGENAVEALRVYLQDVGLDGKKGDLTAPMDCEAAEEADAEGEFCIVTNAGHYAPALAIVFVTGRETGDTWQVHVDLDVNRSVWEVTNVGFLGAD